jgi:alkanesulfonate monooxygenase SsuD/methylene tetrahydromethanopterin reductase-like flavin-dependent oxidoreductase (luciferase family)
VIRRLWNEDEPFDFHGAYVQLTGAFCNPEPPADVARWVTDELISTSG